MALTRRGLFGLFARGTAAAVAGGAVWKLAVKNVLAGTLPWRSQAPTNQKWVMVFDLAKCDGCGDCTKACNKMHYVPPMQEWISLDPQSRLAWRPLSEEAFAFVAKK